jgi:sirohydrochlorin ferrochelatase
MLTHPVHTVGLVIVDHGSKREAANAMLFDAAALFKNVSGAAIVEPAHMELAEPTIEQAFDRCVLQGATLVIVHPYFLSPGRHSTTDIPHLTAAAAARHPGIRYAVTDPLGLDEKIAQVMLQRIEAALHREPTRAAG